MNHHSITGSHYGFSATRIDELGAAEYTLVAIAADTSGSVYNFERDIEKSIAEVVGACHHSPRADNLMLRVTTFANEVDELHGFKPLSSCKTDDYDGRLNAGGGTALYDAAHNAVEAVSTYGRELSNADFHVNAIVFVITDGCENSSRGRIGSVKRAIEKAVKSEALESVTAILIGVDITDPATSAALAKLRKQAGFDRYLEIEKANATSLAKLAHFVGRSIIAQSIALGSGSVSIPLTF
jgi:uncharacterized protein YegL